MFTTWMQFGTKMNWVDFEVNRSEVKVMTRRWSKITCSKCTIPAKAHWLMIDRCPTKHIIAHIGDGWWFAVKDHIVECVLNHHNLSFVHRLLFSSLLCSPVSNIQCYLLCCRMLWIWEETARSFAASRRDNTFPWHRGCAQVHCSLWADRGHKSRRSWTQGSDASQCYFH